MLLRTRCPVCKREIFHHESQEYLDCDSPNCPGSFLRPGVRPKQAPLSEFSPPPAPDPVEVPAVQPAAVPYVAPVLVTPHRCPNCQEAIGEATGVTERTITHTCGARVSLYALQFLTPCCGHFVEVPQSSAGRPLRCPNCDRSFQAPHADILHRRAGDVDPGQVLRWHCEHCQQLLQCNVTFGGRSPVGRSVVCPSCRSLLEVPPCGERA
jgi:hypothetical protein